MLVEQLMMLKTMRTKMIMDVVFRCNKPGDGLLA